MNKHVYLSTWLVDLNNIKMYTVDKQYKTDYMGLCVAFY